jgi:ribosomal protein S18 acetylase RimI-like enzyme
LTKFNTVKDIQEIENIFEQYFRQGTFTNNYVLVKDYERYIKEGRLHIYIYSDNAFLLLDKGNCYRVYYFVNKINEFEIPLSEKPMIMEILYKGSSGLPDQITEFWINCGFVKHLARDCYFLNPGMVINRNIITNHEVEVRTADSIEESKYAQQLIDKYLDPYTGDPLSMEELESFRKEGLLFSTYYKGNKCGILQADFKNNVFWLGHIVVDEDFRGKKVADSLTQAYIQKGLALGCKSFQLWVLQENKPAINLYKKYGFNYFNRSTLSFINKT